MLDKIPGLCYNDIVADRGIAQLVEQRSPKPRVPSSILGAPAKINSLQDAVESFLLVFYFLLFMESDIPPCDLGFQKDIFQVFAVECVV